MNKGTTKIKAISTRALKIREDAGFKTETITRKRYNMPFIPDAIKQAAKELKSSTPAPAKKRSTRIVKTARLKPRKVQKYDYMIVETTYKGEVYKNYIKYIDTTHVAMSGKLTPGKSTAGMGVYHIGQLREEEYYKPMIYWMQSYKKANEIYVYKIGLTPDPKTDKLPIEKSKAKRTSRIVKTGSLPKKAAPAPTGAPLVMKQERARITNKKFIWVSSKGKTFKSTFGIPADELLKKSQLDKYKSLGLIVLYEAITKRELKNTPEFYGKLIEELAKEGKSLSGKAKKMVNVEGFQFGLVQRMPAKIKPGMFGLNNIAVFDPLRPERSGVFVDDGKLIATDAHKLIIIKDVEDLTKKYDQKIIGIHKQNMKQVIDGRYPNYNGVMPKMQDQKEVTDWIVIDDILPTINGNAVIYKSIEYVGKFMILNVKGTKVGVHAENLMHLLNAFKCNGAKKVKIGVRDESRAILIHADNGNTGLVMPMLVNGINERDDFMVKQLKLN